MSVQTEPGYILLTDEINDAERAIMPVDDEMTELKATIKNLNDVQIPQAKAALASWQAAGNSDIDNKMRKIAAWTAKVAELEGERNDAQRRLNTLEIELRRLNDLVSSLKAQRAAFERNYKQAIISGKTPVEATADAEAAAEAAGRGVFNPSTKKTLLIIAGALVAVAIGFYLWKKFKK